jgi:hypothetical protein
MRDIPAAPHAAAALSGHRAADARVGFDGLGAVRAHLGGLAGSQPAFVALDSPENPDEHDSGDHRGEKYEKFFRACHSSAGVGLGAGQAKPPSSVTAWRRSGSGYRCAR